MSELTDFDRGQIVGAQVAGLTIKKTAELCGVSTQTVRKVMSDFNKHGYTPAKKKSVHKPQVKRIRLTKSAANGQAAVGKPEPDSELNSQTPNEESKRPESESEDKEEL